MRVQRPPSGMQGWWHLPKHEFTAEQRTAGTDWQASLDALDTASLLAHLHSLLQPGTPAALCWLSHRSSQIRLRCQAC